VAHYHDDGGDADHHYRDVLQLQRRVRRQCDRRLIADVEEDQRDRESENRSPGRRPPSRRGSVDRAHGVESSHRPAITAPTLGR
jgi:hypothetical protein